MSHSQFSSVQFSSNSVFPLLIGFKVKIESNPVNINPGTDLQGLITITLRECTLFSN